MGKLIFDIFFFNTWSVMGKQNNTVKFGVPGFFGRSGVPGCSAGGVPMFLVLVPTAHLAQTSRRSAKMAAR